MSTDDEFVKNLTEGIDSQEPARFGAFLTEDVSFRFGNAPAVEGRANVEETVKQFYSLIQSLKHYPERTLRSGDVVIGEMMVHYVDQWGRDLKVPVCNLMTMRGDKVCDYRIFCDNSALFIPPEE